VTLLQLSWFPAPSLSLMVMPERLALVLPASRTPTSAVKPATVKSAAVQYGAAAPTLKPAVTAAVTFPTDAEPGASFLTVTGTNTAVPPGTRPEGAVPSLTVTLLAAFPAAAVAPFASLPP